MGKGHRKGFWAVDDVMSLNLNVVAHGLFLFVKIYRVAFFIRALLVVFGYSASVKIF